MLTIGRHFLSGATEGIIFPVNFGVVQCRRCGHLQTNPRPTRNSIQIYYPETYAAHSLSCARVNRSLRDLTLLKLARELGLMGNCFYRLPLIASGKSCLHG
ncbi:MAG: hypothetical protein N3B10_10250 [Armatimonadetes bacterium]|nr:hypothetical protein [Armatimonadota bacterium]